MDRRSHGFDRKRLPVKDENTLLFCILVSGVRNILMREEGVGVHTAQRLGHIVLPPSVEIVDGGTAGIDLYYFLKNRKEVIMIDPIQTPEPPGTISRLIPANIHSNANGEHLSIHQMK